MVYEYMHIHYNLVYSLMYDRTINDQQIDTYQLKSLDGQFGELAFISRHSGWNSDCSHMYS